MYTADIKTMSTPGSTTLAAATKPRLTEALWFNALWFQSVWFCTVLGRETLLPLALTLLGLHLVLVRDTRRELLQMTAVAAVGISVDTALSSSGVFLFPGGSLVPLWLCCLWLAFATTLARSLAWLGRHALLAGFLGALALPLNYWAGQRLGAVQFGYSLPVTLGAMAAVWAVLFPCLFKLTQLIKAPAAIEDRV